ncbi:Protein T19C4.5 a [Aphelenchoides avenae]|nr:Protein T19C4.5 a [Aphelenchus avenae]
MGNSDSQFSESSRTPTSTPRTNHPRLAKHRSLSPQNSISHRGSLENGSPSSCNGADSSHENGTFRRAPRRTKSFRNPHKTKMPGSFRVPVCAVTGLTSNQKKLIVLKWREMDRITIQDMGRNVFETIFRREPRFLRVIGLEELAESQLWRSHVSFRVHVQRFCEALNDVVRALEEPTLATDRLLEFGAAYAFEDSPSQHSRRHIPSAYWDAIVFALNNAAKDLQVQSESSRGSESPSMANERRFLLPVDETLVQAVLLRTSGSVCPLTAEAWNLLAIYVASKIRFGYEMERLLQAEIQRLRQLSTFEREDSVADDEELQQDKDECGSVASRSLCSENMVETECPMA